MSKNQKFYIADEGGVAVVVTERPARPVVLAFRTREHAERLAEKWNADGKEVTVDGEDVHP